MLGIGLGIGIAKEDSNLVFVSGTIVFANVIGIYLGSIVMVAALHRISRDRVYELGGVALVQFCRAILRNARLLHPTKLPRQSPTAAAVKGRFC